MFPPSLTKSHQKESANRPPSFERQQYIEMYKQWQSAKQEDKHKSAADTYGPEHLCRLLGKRTHPPSLPFSS